jgi:hypothetical protein
MSDDCRSGGSGSWEGLRLAFDAEDHTEFTNRVEYCMRMRKKVNIKKIVRAVTANLGASYGAIAERILRRAAINTDIVIVETDNA